MTLWGSGGAGKTRLSLELGARVLARFRDGVWFVELAPLDRAALVAPAIMSALGMLSGSSDESAADDLGHYLAGRQALLVFDNCEHLLESVARLARRLLARCPDLQIVTSSREPLGVSGERTWPVPPLSLPDEDADLAGLANSDAVALFTERARAAQPGFALTEANAAAVGEICRQLDGIPLALELAAARVRVLGVRGLVARLDDRFRLLTGGARTADARHRTLRAAVSWSYDLLPPAERKLLARLSVFPATFDLAAAEALAPENEERGPGFDVLDLLSRLVDKSLVVATDEAEDVRYRMLETIRQFGAEKLEAAHETTTARRCLVEHFVVRTESSRDDWYSWDSEFVFQAHREHHNFLSAVEWAIAAGDAETSVRLVGALWLYWYWAEHVGARDLLERALNLPGTQACAATAEALAGLAMHACSPAAGRQAVQLGEDLGDIRPMPSIYFAAGTTCFLAGETAESTRILAAAISSGQAAGASPVVAWCHYARAWRALRADEVEEARTHLEGALRLAPSSGPGMILGTHLLGTLAVVHAVQGDVVQAERCADNALEAVNRLPFVGIPAMALTRAVAAAALCGHWDTAESRARELLALLRRLGTSRWVAEALELTALVLESTGRPSAAAQVLARAGTYRARTGGLSGGGVPALAAAVERCRRRVASTSETDGTSDLAKPQPQRAASEALILALRALDDEHSAAVTDVARP